MYFCTNDASSTFFHEMNLCENTFSSSALIYVSIRSGCISMHCECTKWDDHLYWVLFCFFKHREVCTVCILWLKYNLYPNTVTVFFNLKHLRHREPKKQKILHISGCAVFFDDRWLYASYMEDKYRDRLIRSCSFHVIPFYNASVKMIQ